MKTKFRAVIKTKEGIKFDYYELKNVDGYFGGKGNSSTTKCSTIGGKLIAKNDT